MRCLREFFYRTWPPLAGAELEGNGGGCDTVVELLDNQVSMVNF